MLKVDNSSVRTQQLAKLERLRAERDQAACDDALRALTAAARASADDARAPGLEQNLLKLSIDAARAHATVGEISAALEEVFGRHTAAIRTITGVYRKEVGEAPNVTKVRTLVDEFAEAQGRRPRILVAKMGQDGHDRGQKVIATAFADLGFDVDVGPLFQTPEEVARQAVEADVHVVGVSTLAAGHLTLVPQLKAALHELDRDDVLVVVGGVIPPQDFDALREAGAAAIFPSGTVIADAASCSTSSLDADELLARRRSRRVPVDLDAYEAGVLAADRTTLGRAITLVESTRRDHQEAAQELLARLLPKAGGAHRIGITGVPGAGKSTFVDALGSELTASGNRVAVLAVDPSSTRTGGSILGDKTRMARLSVDELGVHPPVAVVGRARRRRPGDARDDRRRRGRRLRRRVRRDRRRRAVRGHRRQHGRHVPPADARPLRRQPAGDQEGRARAGRRHRRQQGRRRVRARRPRARRRSWRRALHLMAPREDGWVTPVLTCSALERRDLDTVWDQLRAHRRHLDRTGQLAEHRAARTCGGCGRRSTTACWPASAPP